MYVPKVSVGSMRPGCMSNTTNTVLSPSFLCDLLIISFTTVSLSHKVRGFINNLFFFCSGGFFTL